MTFVWLVVLGVCIHLIMLMLLSGRARVTYNVSAPATTGHEMYERQNRAHLNSLEQAVIFFPLLLVAANTGNPILAALLGVVYLIGRIIYAVDYVKEPSSRAKGMALGFLAMAGLILLSFYNLIMV